MNYIVNRPIGNWKLLIMLLLIGGAGVAFGQGRWPIPLAAWVAPVLLIGFARKAPVWFGIVGITIINALAWEIAYSGMIKMPTLLRIGLLVGLALVLALIFQADRWVSKRSKGFWTTLIFPCGAVTYEYLNGRFSPSGSWASIAYTFSDQLSLAQVVSLVGWTGITFLVMWVASVINRSWDRYRSGEGWLAGSLACAVVVVGLLVFGGVRLWSTPNDESVRVALIAGPSSYSDQGEFRRDVWAYTRGIELPDEQVTAARLHIQRTMERHLALAKRELQAGAQIVSFAEANPSITKQEEGAFLDAASRLAVEFEAYIGLGLYVFRPQADLIPENKFILFGPDGSVVWDYMKAKLVPGSSHETGDGLLPNVETSFGNLSCAICFDMDFPILLQQAGRNESDILLAPSNDWSEVRMMHARMARLRSIEQGFSLVRPTKGGISLATDPYGRTIGWQDTDRPGEHVLVTDVPTSRVVTIYSVIGDAFSWLCVLAFPGLLIFASVRARHDVKPGDLR